MFDLLNGVKILDVTTIIFGPMASQILGDLGADVMKVEALEGDLARSVAPMGPDHMGSMFVNNNRNKRSLALNLKTAAGREIMGRLVAEADVFLHNMRTPAIARLGFDPSSAMKINPKLVYCAAVGFGSVGPYANRPAYDDVIQAASGVASLPLHTGRDAAYVPSVVADKIAALHVVYAILAGLFRRERQARGCVIEVPMFESLVAFLFNEHLGEATFSADGKPGYSRLFNPNRRPFRTSDGWITALPYTEIQWRKVLQEIGRPEVMDFEWFADASSRSRHTKALYGVLAQEMPKRPTAEWLEVFERLDVPYSKVNDLPDLLEDPHLAAVDFFRPFETGGSKVRAIGHPVVFQDLQPKPDKPAPALGADSANILQSLGYTNEEIAQLESDGVLRQAAPREEINP